MFAGGSGGRASRRSISAPPLASRHIVVAGAIQKHANQGENTIKTYVGPIIDALPVAEVDTPLVVKVLGPISNTKTETTARLRGRIEMILDWATVSKYRVGENPARRRGHLEHPLADPTKIGPVVHHPALPLPEIGVFMADLRRRPGIAPRALEFLILTGLRCRSVRGARWDEIDVDSRIWTVPANRMKNKLEFWVPLSSAALALLETLPRSGPLVRILRVCTYRNTKGMHFFRYRIPFPRLEESSDQPLLVITV